MPFYDSKNMFNDGLGIRPFMAFRNEWWFGSDTSLLVDNAAFAIDATAVTPTLANIGGRPCLNLTNSGSTATDGAQFQATTAAILLQTNKVVRMKGSFRMTTATQDLLFGFAAVDTSLIASEATDFIGIRKLAADSNFSFRARKASGTAAAQSFVPAISADTWYDFEFQVKLTSTGTGEVIVNMNQAISPGNAIGLGDNFRVTAALPDTVALAPCFGWRAGSAANVSCYINYLGCIGEA